jgi:hypothetical protein
VSPLATSFGRATSRHPGATELRSPYSR